MSVYIAAYDIANHSSRRRVALVLQDYGHRLQRSVFKVWIEPQELPVLRRRLGALLGKTDDFDLFPLDTRDPKRRIRWQRLPEGWQPVCLH